MPVRGAISRARKLVLTLHRGSCRRRVSIRETVTGNLTPCMSPTLRGWGAGLGVWIAGMGRPGHSWSWGSPLPVRGVSDGGPGGQGCFDRGAVEDEGEAGSEQRPQLLQIDDDVHICVCLHAILRLHHAPHVSNRAFHSMHHSSIYISHICTSYGKKSRAT